MFERFFAGLGKKDAGADLVALQDAVVRGVASDMTDLHDGEWEDREWVYLAVNHEVLIEDGQRSSTQAVVLAHKLGAELEKLSFRLSPASKTAILALRNAMVAAGHSPWTIMDLTVERGGRYDFVFGYGAPPRLNGDLLHTPLSDLLERYREGHPEP